MRSHDHLHPVNKRTNYVFGEWDPDEIDTKGFYRRFIVRRLIIDSLIDWIHQDSNESADHGATVRCLSSAGRHDSDGVSD
jgi:hypothetical protein